MNDRDKSTEKSRKAKSSLYLKKSAEFSSHVLHTALQCAAVCCSVLQCVLRHGTHTKDSDHTHLCLTLEQERGGEELVVLGTFEQRCFAVVV